MYRPTRWTLLGLSVAGMIGACAAGAGVASAVGNPTIAADSFTLTTPSFTVTFTSCTGFGSKTDVSQALAPNGEVVAQTPGATRYDSVVCTRPATADMTLERWRQLVISNQAGAQVNATLATYDAYGNRTALWQLRDAMPSELQDTPNTNGGMTEAVTLMVVSQARQQL